MRRGFSLTELLVSLFIVGVVAGVLYLLYDSVYRVTANQTARHRADAAAVRALDTLARDLAGSLVLEGEPRCEVALVPDGDDPEYATLRFCTALADPEAERPGDYRLWQVDYAVVREPSEPPVLVRGARPLQGPGATAPAATNRLVRGVAAFAAESYDGERWNPAWRNPAQPGLPRAVRLRLELRDRAAPYRMEVHVPHGRRIESSLVRGAAAPAP